MQNRAFYYTVSGQKRNEIDLHLCIERMKDEKNTDLKRGERIENCRKKRHISQGTLADEMEISRQALSKIENGGDYTVLKLLRMTLVLDTTPGEILYGPAEGKSVLIEEVNEEQNGMEELELRKLLAGIRAVKGVR